MATLELLMKAFALVSTLLFSTMAMADPAPTFDRVDFQTEVSREIPNDQMNAVLSIELNDKDPAKLARDLATAMNDALKKAKAFPAVKASSGNQQTWPIYGKTTLGNGTRLDGWRGRAQLKLESRDFQATGELIAQLQNSLQLNGVTFTVADSTRRELENTLTSAAITSFRTRADKIRESWSAKSYRLVNMNLGAAGGGGSYQPMMMAKAMRSEDAAVPAQDFAGGDTRLTVSVSGTIELQP